MVKGVPWNTCRDDSEADGEPPMVVVWPEMGEREARAESETPVPRRPTLRKRDFDEHGLTKGCPGCKAALLGRPSQGHTEACRKRMEENLRDDPRIAKSNKRIDDFLAKTLEKEDRKKAKKEQERTHSDAHVPQPQGDGGASGSGLDRSGVGGGVGDGGVGGQVPLIRGSSRGTTGLGKLQEPAEAKTEKRNVVDGGSDEAACKALRKTFAQGADRKRSEDADTTDSTEKARRIQREKRKDGPYDESGDAKEESDPKRPEPSRVGGIETNEDIKVENLIDTSVCWVNQARVKTVNGLITWDMEKDADEEVTNDEPNCAEAELEESYFDERTWENLDPTMVKRVREEEISFMKTNPYTQKSTRVKPGMSLAEPPSRRSGWM